MLVIGAGQIGSRHLQGLARSRLNLSIEIVDPSASARELAIRRFNEIPANETAKTLRAIDSLESSAFHGCADLAIIATSAGPRYDALRNLLRRISAPYLLLEKVLFQRLSHLEETENLLSKSGCKAWVNCPRRAFPYVRYLKEVFSGDAVSIGVQGGGWELACNGIHFLDLLAFLSGVSIPSGWNIDLLDKAIYQSRRADYKEFGGRIRFSLMGGHEVTLQDNRMNPAPLVIDIIGRRARTTVFESARLMVVCKAETDWKMERHEIHVPYQSELTNLLVEDILSRGVCELTEFAESAGLHKAYLEAFLNHMRTLTGGQEDVCPIT